MLYDFNGKKISISDTEIKNYMASLDISQDEAIELWLDDHDFTVNEEQENLDKKAKESNIKLGLHEKKAKSERKPRTCHVSDEKQMLFNELNAFLVNYCEKNAGSVEILTKNKMFSVKVGEKSFKINITQDRDKK